LKAINNLLTKQHLLQVYYISLQVHHWEEGKRTAGGR